MKLPRRWRAHLSTLRRGQHHNPHLQAAFGKYGEDAFIFAVLERIDDASQLIPREQHYLDALKPEYNIAPTAGSNLGRVWSPETRAKMSEAHRGKHLSMESRRRLSEAISGERHHNYGKHLSAEHRAKLSEAKKGSRHPNYGKQLSLETRAKISAAQSGERNHGYGKPRTQEVKRKISEGVKAHWRRVRGLVDTAV